MIEIKNFTFQYREGARPVVSDVSLAIPDGAFVGITGAAGSGKSTLTYALNGIVPHCYPGDFYGSVVVDGMDTCEVALTDLSRAVGSVCQDVDRRLLPLVIVFPGVVLADSGRPSLHPPIGEKPLACSSGKGEIHFFFEHDDLRVNKIMRSLAFRFGKSMQLLGDLMAERHEGDRLWVGKADASKHCNDVRRDAVIGFLGIADFVMPNFEPDGARCS